jgi:hypothetical protein
MKWPAPYYLISPSSPTPTPSPAYTQHHRRRRPTFEYPFSYLYVSRVYFIPYSTLICTHGQTFFDISFSLSLARSERVAGRKMYTRTEHVHSINPYTNGWKNIIFYLKSPPFATLSHSVCAVFPSRSSSSKNTPALRERVRYVWFWS